MLCVSQRDRHISTLEATRSEVAASGAANSRSQGDGGWAGGQQHAA